MKKYLLLPLITLTLLIICNANAQRILLKQQSVPVSIRGLSVVDDKIAWASSNKGYVATTTDGGKNWNWQQVKGFENADFRGIEAFSDKEAIIMASGTPAVILKTVDGGKNWKVKYRNDDTTYFLDAIDFADKKHGYILGDPINNKLVLLETKNNGESWDMIKDQPEALPGEAAFAASGTCLRVDKNKISIVTGGKTSRIVTSENNGHYWNYMPLPILQGKSSQGAFSFAAGKNENLIVGGDYAKNKINDSVAVIQNGAQFSVLVQQPKGYQSCVEYIGDEIFLSTGTPGSNITIDGGKTWNKFDGISYNVCRKAKIGKLILFAGDNGKIGIFKL